MKRFGVLLTGCTMIALPAKMAAQRASLEICNHGKIPISVAYAARIQLLLTGYRWETDGWYSVDQGACRVVYDESYDGAGPITPQSGARVALIAHVGGTWRALQHNATDTQGWMKAGIGQICVDLKANGFRYQEPQGDPAAGCGTMTKPAAWDFLPAEPGQYTYNINWDGGAPSVVISGEDPAIASAAAPGSVTYFCSSTDQRPVMYFSDIFDAPDAGSDADNFITYQHAVLQFQIYLVEHYQFPGDDGLVACVHAPTVAGTATTMAEKKRSLAAAVGTAGEKVVQTGWKYVPAQPGTIPINKDRERAYYDVLSEDVAAALPADWTATPPNPFGGNLPSAGYRSTSGAHGEIWLTETQGGEYELNVQLVSAPIRR